MVASPVDGLLFWQELAAPLGTHNKPYVNLFVRGLRLSWWLRFSSTVSGPRPVTRIVEKAAPVASEFDWILSPYSDGFRFIARDGWCACGWTGVRGPLAPTSWLGVCRRSAVVQAVAPLASQRSAALPAGRPVGHGSQPVRRRPQLGPASVSLLTPAVLGVLKARRAGLLSGMGLPWLLLFGVQCNTERVPCH